MANKLEVQVVNKSTNELPQYKTLGSSGMDVQAFLPDGSIELKPFERVLIPTGLYFQLSEGWEIQVRPRSGLAIKNGITVLNTPGTVDADYSGELKIILINLSKESFVVFSGDRIAQLVFSPVAQAELKLVTEINTDTDRGSEGFGHTGIN